MMNEDVRKAIRISDMKQWQVAELVGVNEATFSRWLRYELPQDKKDRIMQVIRDHGKAGEAR